MSGSPKRKATESTDTSQDLSSNCEIPRERNTELSFEKGEEQSKEKQTRPWSWHGDQLRHTFQSQRTPWLRRLLQEHCFRHCGWQ
ncbi:hypothetical protein BaRGS_00012466 [Batillaria attramentaria]|uniref:Uncharacterized protein n=1 Tax=Batillaria attramentaria TaxID=370345 RepID=A0ABD0L9R6_9CAEN